MKKIKISSLSKEEQKRLTGGAPGCSICSCMCRCNPANIVTSAYDGNPAANNNTSSGIQTTTKDTTANPG